MNTMTLPIISSVTGYTQQNGLTTLFFQCNMFDGRGILNRDFQINTYELHWYYNSKGWNKQYSIFNDFWQTATEETKFTFLFLLLSDEKSVVASSAKAKVRGEVKLAEIIHLLALQRKAV